MLEERKYISIVVVHRRLMWLHLCAFVMMIILLWRITHVMLYTRLQTRTHVPYVHTIVRGEIVDRHGQLLASSVPSVSSFCFVENIENIELFQQQMQSICPDLKVSLENKKGFVWLQRHMSQSEVQEILDRGIVGVEFAECNKRTYPDREIFAKVVGNTDVDGNGISGIELSHNAALNAREQIKLSLDGKIQYIAYHELMKGMQKFDAKAAAAIVMDVMNGHVLAMCVVEKDKSKSSDFNILMHSSIEPGSCAKILNTALAFENGIGAQEVFDATNPIQIAGFTINDYRGKKRPLTVEEIFKYSSNIGSAKMVDVIGAETQYAFMCRIGLASKMHGLASPLFPQKASRIKAMTMAFGHGFSCAPMQFANIIAGIVNDGLMYEYTLLCDKHTNYKRLVSVETSRKIRALLELNVRNGANRKAYIKGLRIGGKSGTTEKIVSGKYVKNSNYTSFVGAFPMNAPRYLVYVLLDEPHGIPETYGYTTAGWNAAPIAAKIIEQIAVLYAIVPVEEPSIADLEAQLH